MGSLYLAALAACAPLPARVVVSSVPFDAGQAAYIHESGPNAITGQAFLRQRGGGVVTCAGEPVSLVPVTDHAIDRFRQIYGSDQGGIVRFPTDLDVESRRDPTYDSYTRRSECDAEGDFEFTGLPDGDYFVTTGVYWETGRGPEGGSLARRVRVSGGETARVLLN